MNCECLLITGAGWWHITLVIVSKVQGKSVHQEGQHFLLCLRLGREIKGYCVGVFCVTCWMRCCREGKGDGGPMSLLTLHQSVCGNDKLCPDLKYRRLQWKSAQESENCSLWSTCESAMLRNSFCGTVLTCSTPVQSSYLSDKVIVTEQGQLKDAPMKKGQQNLKLYSQRHCTIWTTTLPLSALLCNLHICEKVWGIWGTLYFQFYLASLNQRALTMNSCQPSPVDC